MSRLQILRERVRLSGQAHDLVPAGPGVPPGVMAQMGQRVRSSWEKVQVWRLEIASVVGCYLKEHVSDFNVCESPKKSC